MADFCRQCSIDNFGKDSEDLKGLTTEEDWAKGLAQVVICEGCGYVRVNPEGVCAGGPQCLKKHPTLEED